MSLANFLLRTALGNDRAPDQLTVALFDGPIELADPGYHRFTVPKGSWRIMNEIASTTATFGPFQGTTDFDRTRVYGRGVEPIDEKIVDGDPRRVGQTDVIRLEIDLNLKAP